MLYSAVTAEIRSLLNDVANTLYTDTAVLPCVKKAVRELQEEYRARHIAPFTYKSIVGTVNAFNGFSTSAAALATDMLHPTNLEEADLGMTNGPFYPMDRKMDQPEEYAQATWGSSFTIWWWKNGLIYLPGLLTNRLVRISYVAGLAPDPEAIVVGDTVGSPNHKSFLAAKAAAIAALTIGENEERAATLAVDADNALNRLFDAEIGEAQAFGVRRRGYRTSRR